MDLRDAVGDRLFLSDGFRRDGTLFDVGQATTLKEHAEALSARQAISQSRKSRGFFDAFKRNPQADYKPTYNYEPSGTACRVYGTVPVKKVTGQLMNYFRSVINPSLINFASLANLHITTLGHGYASHMHVDHKCAYSSITLLYEILISQTVVVLVMNLSHVITEFSFGPYFPDITQPLDNSFELTDQREWYQGGDKRYHLF